MERQIKNLRSIYIFLTLFLIFLQFYALSLKFSFEKAVANKSIGFFSIYLHKLTNSFVLWPPLISFMLAHFLLQFAFAFLIFFITREMAKLSPLFKNNIFFCGVILWLISQINVYLWNAILYPYSFFSYVLFQSVPHVVLITLLALTSLILFIVVLVIIFKLIIKKPFIVLGLVVFVASLFVASTLVHAFSPAYFFKQHRQPNIILVITDSLRPDYAYANGALNPVHIQKFLSHAAFFDNAFSLLGRSTPGLASILTGTYPKNNGARFNLIPSNYLHLENSLTSILKTAGYQTILAADGLQFLNIDNSFGFDEVISPKQGIYDFIFSLINDTPLSNLLMNSPVGETFFPYNYANRSAYYTYEPHSFIDLVNDKLMNKNPDKPVLFVAPLTIAHWPYVWARQSKLTTLADRYEDAVLQLDKQFDELLRLLQRRGILQNSIILTLSDHGDSLGLPGDRIITPQNYEGQDHRLSLISRFPYMVKGNQRLLGIDTSMGHGTDLLSMTQLHTTLAVSFSQKIYPQLINERVALIDVLPTLLDLLKLPSPSALDGISLQGVMTGQKKLALFNRPLFLESEIDIPSIDVTRQGESSLIKLINQYIDSYDIDVATQNVILKDGAIPQLLSEKQRGVIDGDWLLVKFPGKNRLQTYLLPANSVDIKNCYYYFRPDQKHSSDRIFCYRLSPTVPYYVLINLKTKKWHIYLVGEKVADPIFNVLLQKLQTFYGNEL